MPAERSLLPRDIRRIMEWAKDWDAIPTRKQIATELRVSEATVTRIARNGGYKPKKRRLDIEALAHSIDAEKSIQL